MELSTIGTLVFERSSQFLDDLRLSRKVTRGESIKLTTIEIMNNRTIDIPELGCCVTHRSDSMHASPGYSSGHMELIGIYMSEIHTDYCPVVGIGRM